MRVTTASRKTNARPFGVRRRAAILSSLMAIGIAGPSTFAQAAFVHEETFAGGQSGWTNSGSLTTGATNGLLRGRFAAQTIPTPGTGAFVAANGSSAGAFIGDYHAAGIHLVGFSFMAQDVLPSAALLRWQGPTSSYFRSFAAYVVATGVWYRLAFSLESKEAGGWTGGGEEAFRADLADVQRIEIQLSRSGMAAQRFQIDDVFVDELPAGLIAPAADGVHILWSALQPGATYAVDVAGQPTKPWIETGLFAATNRVQEWIDPDADSAEGRIYRLRFGECR